MKTLFSHSQQLSLPKVRKTRLQADFITNNQILVVKEIKIRPPLIPTSPPRLLHFMNFSDSPFIETPPPPPLFYSGPKISILPNICDFFISNIIDKSLVILFTIKSYARNSVFKYIKRKHGQDIIAPITSYESLKTKYMKVQSDIKLINSCKKESLIPTFAKVNLSIKNASRKLKSRI